MRSILTYAIFTVLSLQAVAASAESVDSTKAQTSDLSLSLEIKSRHVWRGGLTTRSWNMQPTLEYSGIKNLTLGAWGCYTVNNEYAEVDLYAGYSIGNFNLTLYDYFNPMPSEDGDNHHFFNFDRKVTGHQIDATIGYSFGSIPLKLMASTIVYGADLNDNEHNRYSTYLEASYEQTLSSGQTISYFVGGTPYKSMYYNSANVVNLGFKVSQDVKIGSYSLPVNGSIIVNPARGNLYLIVGICPF
jgi:hypothetical protein